MSTARGTTNTNDRDNSRDRRRRRFWLVSTFRANVDLRVDIDMFTLAEVEHEVPRGQGEPACRCYRCGVLLTVDTVTADRRVPGVEGGTYWDKGNLRPACGPCNSETGGALGAARKRAMASSRCAS